MGRKIVIFLVFFVVSCTKPSFWDPSPLVSETPSTLAKTSPKERREIKKIRPSCVHIDPKQPLSLVDLVDLAMMISPDLRNSWEDAKIAAYQYASSQSTYFPSFTANGSWYKLDEFTVYNDTGFNQKVTYWGPYVSFEFLIFDFGVRRGEVEAAYQYLQSKNWTQSFMIQSTLKSVVLDYYDVLYQKGLVQAREEDLVNAKETLNAAREKVIFGIIDESELMQAKTNYYQKKLNLTEQQNIFDKSTIALLRSIGITSNAQVETINFPKVHLDAFQFDEQELLTKAENNRPDFFATKALMMQSKAHLKKIEGEVLPQISFQGSGGQNWYKVGITDGGNYGIQFNLTFPLFQGFYYKNQIQKAKKEVSKAQVAVDMKWNDITAEVRNAYTDFVSAKRDYRSAKNYLEAAKVQFSAILSRYRSGVNTILDVFNAAAFLSDARAKFIEAERDFYASLVSISFATGSLSQPKPEQELSCIQK